jgi:hypothetical protein
MKIENKIRSLIREEIQKILLQEKFQSRTLSYVFSKFGGGDKKFFAQTAKNNGFDWANMPDDAIRQGANPSNNFMNIFLVDSRKENPFQSGWEGSIYPGIIGITIGKKSMYWPDTRWRYSKGSGNMIGNQGKKLDNYKRYNQVADTIYNIDLTKIPSNKDVQAARAEAKKGATALMKNKDVVNQNMKRYKKALESKIMDKGPDELKRMLDEATAICEKVFKFTTDMLKKGMYNTGWDSYQTISGRYGDMVRAYENYVRDFEAMQKEKDSDLNKNYDWRKDYVANRAGEVKGYYKELLKKAKIVMNKDNYKPITGSR